MAIVFVAAAYVFLMFEAAPTYGIGLLAAGTLIRVCCDRVGVCFGAQAITMF